MKDGNPLPKGCALTLAIIFLASLIDGLDASIVTVALPTMSSHFHVSAADGSWFVFSYVVGIAAFLIPMGKMAKNNRVKKFMVAGTALFCFSSLMCGFSTSFWMLVGFRLLQGIAAAMTGCVLPSMIVHMLPADRKGLGMSIMGAASGMALILGPSLGGFVTDALSWNWIFFINIPICALIIILAMKHIPRDEAPLKDRDPTLVGGVSAMLLIGSLLIMMEDLGDPDINTIGRLICAAIVAVSLPVLIWSIRRDAKRAIIAPKVLKNREYLLVSASFLLCTVVVAGAEFLLPFVFQESWHVSPTETGVYMSIMSVAMIVAVIPVGRMCDRYGCKWPSAMAVALRAGFCAAFIVIAAVKGDVILMIPALIVFGLSHAFSGTAQPTRMIHHSTPSYEDEATNLMLMINYLASALGCSLFALVFSLSTADVHIPEDAYMQGFSDTMVFSLVLLAVAMICTLAVKNKIVRKDDREATWRLMLHLSAEPSNPEQIRTMGELSNMDACFDQPPVICANAMHLYNRL